MAVKVSKDTENNDTLQKEIQVLTCDNDFSCLPKIMDAGYIGPENEFMFIVMERLGSDLKRLHPGVENGGFNLTTTMFIAHEVLKGLESLHNRGFIHNDIKLDNIALAFNNPRQIKILDFGLAEEYLKPDGTHKPEHRARYIVGTDCYNSLRKNYGFAGTRQDDMENFIYVIMECYRMLPWHNDEDLEVIKEKKGEVLQLDTSSELCKWPIVFEELLGLVVNMELFDEPPYERMHWIFADCLVELQGSGETLPWE